MIFTAIFVFSVNDLSSSLPLFVLNQGIHLFLYWFVSILIDRFLYKNTNLCYPWIFFSLFFVCLLIFMVAFAMSKNQKCEIGWSVFSFLVLLWLMLLKRTLLSYISSFCLSFSFLSLLLSLPWSMELGKRWEAWPRSRSRCVTICYFSLRLDSYTASQISVLLASSNSIIIIR